MGNTFVWFALAFFLALLALMVWDTMQRRAAASAGADPDLRLLGRSTTAIVLAAVVIITAVGATYRVYQVGHSGAKSVWEQDASLFDGSGSSGDEG